MKVDSLVLSAIIKDIKENCLNKRVDNIYQPFPHTILFSMVLSEDIILSIEPNNERIHLTDKKYQNPPSPPSFCSQLRKYIRGSFLKDVEQIEWERIAILHFPQNVQLVVEIMGRHSNIILVKDGEIKGALKLIDETKSSKRRVLPGLPYQLPPTMGRKNPLTIGADEMLNDLLNSEGQLSKILQNLYQGMSPFLINELLLRAELPLDASSPFGEKELSRLVACWEEFKEKIKSGDFKPVLLKKEGKLVGYWAFPTIQDYEIEERKNMSEAIDEFHYLKLQETTLLTMKEQLKEELRGQIEKWQKVKENCEKALKEWGNVERYYEMGSLILANLRLVRKGMESITLENFFDDQRRKITIPLSKELNPQQNADKYFQLYRKGKKAVEELNARIKKAEEELKTLTERYEMVEKCQSIEELEAIREGKEIKKERAKKEPSLPTVRSSDGFIIQYGKNARQNELLLKSSSPDDIWLHARGVKGAHIVIKREGKKEVPFRTIKEAAQLAAYLSSARGSSVVPVDWTLRKYVRKPKKSEKGFVIYSREKTLMVEPAPIEGVM
ncbi:NFACT family protein [bacterium]|nr:NFACT family protein [bacterium]